MSENVKPEFPPNVDIRLWDWSAERAIATAVWRALSRVAAALWHSRAEILLTLAMLGGWTLLTWGVALITTWKVWPLSGGLLLLSCGGWRMLWTMASYGLYGLTRETKRGR